MNEKPIIIYDFDGTLTPYAWTKFKILEECGLEDGGSNPEFVRRVIERAEKEHTNTYASLWEVYFDYLRKNGFSLTDENFRLGADAIDYNPGVPDFFKTVSKLPVGNYLLSSGLKAFLEHTVVAPYFTDIFATTFSYDENNRANGVDFLMHEQNKVKIIQSLLAQNRHDPENASRVVYIGDGLTDYFAMDYVKSHGGHSVFVYQESQIEQNPSNSQTQPIPQDQSSSQAQQISQDQSGDQAQQFSQDQSSSQGQPANPSEVLASLQAKNAVSFAAPADYSPDSPLRTYLRQSLSL